MSKLNLINNRQFSVSVCSLADNNEKITDLLAKFDKNHQDHKKFLEELKNSKSEQLENNFKQDVSKEKPISKNENFIDEMENKVNNIGIKQDKERDKLAGYVEKTSDKYLNDKQYDELFDKYPSLVDKEKDKYQNKLKNLEDEYQDNKGIEYLDKKMDLKFSSTKRITQLYEKQEKEMNDMIEENSDNFSLKEKYEKERAEILKQHGENVKTYREEKKNLKEELVSKKETHSEMAESLTETEMPDYTNED
jgi:hypothetical protein